MKRNRLFVPILVCLVLSQCKTGPGSEKKISGYNFSFPESSIFLPAILHEISGIVMADSGSLACIQDENGIVFFYDLEMKKITRQIVFGPDGDYEGIARADDTLYVLRSDGFVYGIEDFRSDSYKVVSYQTEIPSKDNEGLCYDNQNRRLLIACKERTGKGDLSKDERYVFGFDPVTGRLSRDPVYSFDIKEILDFAAVNDIPLPMRGKKKGPPEPFLNFHSSSIGIHPLTNMIYILSADDFLLLVFDRAGRINRVIMLNRGLFNQPEGIAFRNNGDMIISNEGMKKGPGSLRLLTFHPGP
jgi:hypothetical protein